MRKKIDILRDLHTAEDKFTNLVQWLRESHRDVYDEYLGKVNIVTGEIEKPREERPSRSMAARQIAQRKMWEGSNYYGPDR